MMRGFTIVEMILALVLAGLLIAGGISFYMMAQTAWKEGDTQIRLQRSANNAMEAMTRGAGSSLDVWGRAGLREATSWSIPSTTPANSQIIFMDGIDGTTRSFYLQGSDLIYDPDTKASGNEIVMTENVTTLQFQNSSSSRIAIALTLAEDVASRTMSVSLNTEVLLRN